MTIPQDNTATMPESAQTSTADVGNALMSAMSGEGSAVPAQDKWEPESHVTSPTDLESLTEYDKDSPAVDIDPNAEASAQPSVDNIQEVELKVKGYDKPVKVKIDPADESFKSLLNKGLRFDKRVQEIAQQSKDLEAKLQKFADSESKFEVAERVEAARRLMDQGHKEHALATIFGENTEAFIESLVEERVAYQNASPEKRLQMDLEKQKSTEQLQRQKDADRIAALEARLNARSEQVQETEFSGYIEDARSRYDLSQWVDDADAVSDLNDMLHSAAMADIIKIQRKREANGEQNVTQRDIRRAYANRAKRLIQNQERTSSKIADEKVSQQSEVSKQNAQVASTRNYGQPDIASEWQKGNGSMSDLVDMLRGRGSI
jgi:hypothetical protein